MGEGRPAREEGAERFISASSPLASSASHYLQEGDISDSGERERNAGHEINTEFENNY